MPSNVQLFPETPNYQKDCVNRTIQNYNRGRNHDTKACSKTADINGPNQSNGEMIGQKHELGTGG